MILQPGTYAILNDAGNAVAEIRVITVAVNAKDGRAKPVVMTAQPAFNAATQKVAQNGWTINVNDVTPIWQIVALSQAELDEITERNQLVTLSATVTDMLNGTGTTAARLNRVEQALGRLFKRLEKNGAIP